MSAYSKRLFIKLDSRKVGSIRVGEGYTVWQSALAFQALMKTRLEKPHLVELGPDGKPRACETLSPRGLFHL